MDMATETQPSFFESDYESSSSTNGKHKSCCMGSKNNHKHSPDKSNMSMSRPRNWLHRLMHLLNLSCFKSIPVIDGGKNTLEVRGVFVEEIEVEDGTRLLVERTLSPEEEAAALKIESCFRGHLARRAFRALKSLVKFQALVRGVYVRRQSEIAIRIMQILVRLQIRVRSRQLVHLSRQP